MRQYLTQTQKPRKNPVSRLTQGLKKPGFYENFRHRRQPPKKPGFSTSPKALNQNSPISAIIKTILSTPTYPP
ncbi:MAG: hypothetical protein JGK26_18470 [Microcoleus sp. PH2017_27_LUM_O_A]|uniref:hypothetical protein n=1 Tax=unclassified Microcoleus TaxID=2642155 RepID=UPI001DCA4B0B|nr:MULTISPECIES: hypothetical protein [unclassified Microcoleus]MCC3461892.1 hypothetical protein [Microcoleus sp. PH2017_11_PCY_U_A]MCC3480278.1 hypothetical protein [Microcoleus sp. PH2017_12_PCY_D_A]MCC3561082.1 hypothetical protein [Microcoleus sp. PH2017_27_LUM_O_A]